MAISKRLNCRPMAILSCGQAGWTAATRRANCTRTSNWECAKISRHVLHRTTIDTEYVPQYPTSHTDFSYGVGPGSRTSSLVPRGATGKFLTPSSAPLAGDWRSTGFDDSGWSNVTTGIGFQTDSLPRSTPIGYWRFDDTAVDASGGSHNATLYIRGKLFG